MSEEILGFISRFTDKGRSEQVVAAFTGGCCYWFARVLCERFAAFSPALVYDPVMNHFGAEIRGLVYDITGDVTDLYTWTPWERVTDPLLRSRIVDNCVMFRR